MQNLSYRHSVSVHHLGDPSYAQKSVFLHSFINFPNFPLGYFSYRSSSSTSFLCLENRNIALSPNTFFNIYKYPLEIFFNCTRKLSLMRCTTFKLTMIAALLHNTCPLQSKLRRRQLSETKERLFLKFCNTNLLHVIARWGMHSFFNKLPRLVYMGYSISDG